MAGRQHFPQIFLWYMIVFVQPSFYHGNLNGFRIFVYNFISHFGCSPNHINISAQKYIGFGHHGTLIVKWSKPMKSDDRELCPNRIACIASGSCEAHSCHGFYPFGRIWCTGGKSFSIIEGTYTYKTADFGNDPFCLFFCCCRVYIHM